jgi:chromosome transmission fidelity protein 4
LHNGQFLKNETKPLILCSFSLWSWLLIFSRQKKKTKIWREKKKKKSAMNFGAKVLWEQVHMDGMSDMCYDVGGKVLVSCGVEASLSLTSVAIVQENGAENVESELVDHHADAATCVDASPDGLYIVSGSADRTVALYKRVSKKVKFDSTLMRFALPATAVAFSPDAMYVAGGSEDGSVKLVAIADPSQVRQLRKVGSSIRSLAFDVRGKWLALSCGDGTLAVYDVATLAELCSLKKMLPEGSPRALRGKATTNGATDDAADRYRSRAAWQPGASAGAMLAVPVKKGIALVSPGTWSTVGMLGGGEHEAPVDGVTWSSCGNYLASYDVAAQIIVWDVRRGASLHAFQHDTPVCAIQWSPAASSQVALIDWSGQLGVWHDVLAGTAAAAADRKGTEVAAANAAASSIDSLMPDDDDDKSSMFDDEAGSDQDERKSNDADSNLLAHHQGVSLGDDSDDDVPMLERRAEPSTSSYTSAMLLASAPQPLAPAAEQPYAPSPPPPPTAVDYDARTRYAVDRQLPAQCAFQPGATPLGKKRRFLCYTLLGSITSLAEGAHWSVEVKFADRALRPVRFTEHDNMTMAAMSEQGAVFACRAEGDAQSASTIMYRAFDSWSSADADWRLMLDADEQVEAVAVGDQWVAAATDRRYVRLMSAGGVQRMLFSLPGDVVTMAGDGDALAIVYHVAAPDGGGSQRLALQRYSVSARETTWRGALPLSPRSVLTWLGFAESGTIVCGDSKGVARAIEPSFSSEWLPLADTRRQLGTDKTYWPIGLSALEQLVCIETEPDRYPRPLPEPIVAAVPLAVPLAELTMDAAQLDEAHLRDQVDMALKKSSASMLSPRELSAAQASVDRRLLASIKEQIDASRLVRAFDLCEQLGLRKSLTIAATIASRARQTALEDRIYELIEARQVAAPPPSTLYAVSPALAPRSSSSAASSVSPYGDDAASQAMPPRTPPPKAHRHSAALNKTIQLLRSPSDVGISAAQKASISGDDDDDDEEQVVVTAAANKRRRSAPFSVAKRPLNLDSDVANGSSIFASITSMSKNNKRQRT